MSEKVTVRFAGTACEALSDSQLADMAIEGSGGAFLDNMGRPMLSVGRERALRGLERFRWWNATEHFPEEPDETQQTAALANWFLGFTMSSSMLMAPVLGGVAAVSFSDAEVGIRADVYTAIAIISLMLLILILARFARPVWGERGDPCLPLRRIFFFLLPIPVIAANWWLAYPARSVRAIGLFMPLLAILLLIGMVVWFLALYFQYTERVHIHEHRQNRTPDSVINSFYSLLSHVKTSKERERHLVQVAQYFTEFSQSKKLESEAPGEPVRWEWPQRDRPTTLKEIGADLVKHIRLLTSGDQLQHLAIKDSVFLRPLENDAEQDVICFTGVLQYRVTRGVLAPSANETPGQRGEVFGQLYVAHTLAPKPDGWYIENGSLVVLTEKDRTELREHGLLG